LGVFHLFVILASTEKEANMSKSTHTATLKDGRIYVLMIQNEKEPTKPVSITFEQDKPKPVTAAIKARLEEQAVDVNYFRGREEMRCKFEFTPISVAAKPRDRTAAPATTQPTPPQEA
jgi:hypothetical protein